MSRQHENNQEKLRLLILCSAAVFCFGLAAHAYGFLNASFSHDMLNALVTDNVETYWKMQLGRPGIVLYRRLFRSAIAAPWQLGLLSLCWLSLSCYGITKLFAVRSRLFPILLAGILSVNITTIAQTATYLYEMDADLFAVLLGVCAVLLWDRAGWKGAVCGMLLTACCMAIYQSMLSVPITLCMMQCIVILLRGDAAVPVLKKGLRAVLMLGIGAVVYILSVRVMCHWKGINLAMDSYNSMEQVVSASILQRIGHVYRTWAAAFWDPEHAHIALPVLVANILLPLIGLWRLLLWLLKRNPGRRETVLLLVLIGLLPLGMNTAQLSFSRDIHDLMKYAFWFFHILCLLPIFLCPLPKKASQLSGLLASAFVIIILCSNMQTANIVYTKKQLEQDAALSLMTRVVYRLEEEPEYIAGETPLVFVGVSRQLQEKIPGFEAYYDITGCESSSPIVKSLASYNYHAYAAYFRYILNNPAIMADWTIWNAMQENPDVQNMPCYPDHGCIRIIDGQMVVKMGSLSAPMEGAPA